MSPQRVFSACDVLFIEHAMWIVSVLSSSGQNSESIIAGHCVKLRSSHRCGLRFGHGRVLGQLFWTDV